MNKLLSIIVPVYNAGDYLSPLVKSILEQTYSDIELLLIDDGSTDGSGALCDNLALKDKRIFVIHKKNGGQSSARNEGLMYAKGEFIAFADNDDIVHPDMYKDLILVMESTGADICACDFKNVDNNAIDKIVFDSSLAISTEMSKHELLNDFFKPTWRIPIWNKIYRANLVKQMRFGNYHLGEDNLFSYQVINNCCKYVFCDHTYYFQRMHGMNYEFTATEYMIDLLEAKEKILCEIENNYPECYRICQKSFLYECIRIFNIYSKKDDLNKTKQILEMIRGNMKGIILSDMPIGHKKLFLKIKYTNKYRNCRRIII